jgi:hypothetical protein
MGQETANGHFAKKGRKTKSSQAAAKQPQNAFYLLIKHP